MDLADQPERIQFDLRNEANFMFYDCTGTHLKQQDLVKFFVDSLEGISYAIKTVNPSAKVVMNFLGRSGFPCAYHLIDLGVCPSASMSRITYLSNPGRSLPI